MTVVRGFARYMAGIDPRTQVPPLGLIPSRQRWRAPFIYSSSDVAALMAAARSIHQCLPAATHETIIGLLATTGLRVGEALKLDRSDIDWSDGVLLIRESRFTKTRKVPALAFTLGALEHYAVVRDELCERPTTRSFRVAEADESHLPRCPAGLSASLRGDRGRKGRSEPFEDSRLPTFVRREHAARVVSGGRER